jgi:mannose-6-phosphate isomerase-like protein (cupin superfamily)
MRTKVDTHCAKGWEDLQIVDLAKTGQSRGLARAQNFSVEWLIGDAGQSFAYGSDHETILLFPAVGGRLTGSADEAAPPRSVVIAPPGSYEVALDQAGAFAILATHRTDQPTAVDRPDARIISVGRPFAPKRAAVRVHRLDDVPYPEGNPRLKFLQSETMSINVVEYSGARSRSALSPHSHAAFEQATLTVAGDFLHHFRTEWGKDADLWREDQHVPVGQAVVAVIPPNVIHTTEGVGAGHHMLFDIFAPPREDFIAKNWVHNAEDYARNEPPAAPSC